MNILSYAVSDIINYPNSVHFENVLMPEEIAYSDITPQQYNYNPYRVIPAELDGEGTHILQYPTQYSDFTCAIQFTSN